MTPTDESMTETTMSDYTSITQYLTPEDVGHEPTDDLEAFCDRATDWLTDNEPDHWALEVIPARPGEAGRVVLDATGISINVALEEDEREEVYYLFEQAWMYACSTDQNVCEDCGKTAD